MSADSSSLWNETKEWHGRLATMSCVFYKALVKEIKGAGIIWFVKDSDEIIARGTETDYGTAMHKAQTAMLALTEGY